MTALPILTNKNFEPSTSKLIQAVWDLSKANTCNRTISTYMPVSAKMDCTIQSLAALGLIKMDSANTISKNIHTVNESYMPKLNAIKRLLKNKSGSNISDIWFNRYPEIITPDGLRGVFLDGKYTNYHTNDFNYLEQYLTNKLANNNCTLFSYYRTVGIGHTILIRRQDNGSLPFFLCSDIQQGKEFRLTDLLNYEPNLSVCILFEGSNTKPSSMNASIQRNSASLLRNSNPTPSRSSPTEMDMDMDIDIPLSAPQISAPSRSKSKKKTLKRFRKNSTRSKTYKTSKLPNWVGK
jgi:hypothetical protein